MFGYGGKKDKTESTKTKSITEEIQERINHSAQLRTTTDRLLDALLLTYLVFAIVLICFLTVVLAKYITLLNINIEAAKTNLQIMQKILASVG